jgi:POT family proton-dependent oligopeptide transporter
MPTYKIVFIASGVGMLLSLVWFWFGRAPAEGIGRPPRRTGGRIWPWCWRLVVAMPVYYFLLTIDATKLQVDPDRCLVVRRSAGGRRHPRGQGRATR